MNITEMLTFVCSSLALAFAVKNFNRSINFSRFSNLSRFSSQTFLRCAHCISQMTVND